MDQTQHVDLMNMFTCEFGLIFKAKYFLPQHYSKTESYNNWLQSICEISSKNYFSVGQ